MGDRIYITPMSFYPEYRVQASKIATERGVGLRMEVYNAHTEYYADERVPVGKVDVWCTQSYGASFPEHETTLDSPEERWFPKSWG